MPVALPRHWIVACLLAILLTGCTVVEPTAVLSLPTLTPTSVVTAEPVAQAEATATPDAEPTATDTPTPEPEPTATAVEEPTPTDTPTATPTHTATPTPAPVTPTRPVSGALNVYYLDVGQGDSTLLMGPDFTILIDAGRHDRSDVVPHLERYGVQAIDLLIGTHPHADHIGQMDKVLQRFEVGEVWMSGDESTSLTFERVLDAIGASGAGYHEPRAGEVYDIGSAVVEVVNPSSLINDLNEDSVSVRIVYGDIAFLFTGDAETRSEAAMVARGHDLRAHVLQMGHHGSRTSSTQPFLNAVQPDVAIWSASEGNSYGHPHGEVIDRVAAMGIATYGTAEHGTIVVTTDGRCYDVLVNGARAPPVGHGQNGMTNAVATVHVGPDDQSAAVDHLNPCTRVIAFGRNATGEWLLVDTKDGQQGWIAASLVEHVAVDELPEIDDSGNSDDLQPATVISSANLRAGPGTTFDVVGSAAAGMVVEPSGRNAASDWIFVATPTGQQAWIALFLVDGVDVNALAVVDASEEPPTPVPPTPIPPTPIPDRVNINTASHAELQRIIHIGPARATEMLQLRPFTSVDDMQRINGIGPARLADIKAQGIAYVAQGEIPPPPTNCAPGQVNINTASHSELQRIIHIGPARADQMLQLRPFTSVDAMTRISGIAAARLADIKAQGIACVD